MKTLAVDIETYSPVDLGKSGVYPYAEHPDFEILLFAYAFDDNPVKCVDLAQRESLPEEVKKALTDPNIVKTAWNANFERVCIKNFFSVDLPIEQWECTMVKAAMLSLPLSLDIASKVLRLEQEKMSVGKALIRYFSLPCKPTKSNGGRTRNFPKHDKGKWDLFKSYCIRDVEVEAAIRKKIAFFQIPDQERNLYILDQTINDRGVCLDMQMVNNAIEMDGIHNSRLSTEATELTSLDNPNSVSQLKQWISGEMGEDVASLSKETIPELLKNTSNEDVIKVLQIRQEMAKTSVKKYEAMEKAVCGDGRVRGLLQFYGANRTGRFAGRLVQVQNLPQNHLLDLDLARNLVKTNDLDGLELLFGNVPDTLSQLIRTAFVAKEGHTFAVADFSAIELVVAAWLADEKWVLDEFISTRKVYEQTAARMLSIPVEQITKESPERQKGKIASLACQYGGGVGALESMGALKMGIPEEELPKIVSQWRTANPNIVKFWSILDTAAKKSIEDRSVVTVKKGIRFDTKNGILSIILPSGRKLSYLRPRIGENRFGGKSVCYEGMDQTTKQWRAQETYGGKIFENLCQAVARDCLAYAMLNLEKAGYRIVCHVHDEVVIEHPKKENALDDVIGIMTQPIPWAVGLPLRAEGFISTYYKK